MTSKPAMIVYQDKPFNAGPPLELLCQSPNTPIDLFFVRNHGDVPSVDSATYHLSIDGAPHSLSLSLDELQHRFPKVTLEATLQCAGNRRREFMTVQSIPDELAWGADAIGSAVWSGARLRDVLFAARIDREPDQALHVAFEGLDRIVQRDQYSHFGGSISIDKALSPEVILAYEMNGEPLAPVHGFPLRVVVPGYIGARSIKWLSHITIQRTPSANYFQAHAYKLFPPNVQPATANWDTGLMLCEMPVNAVICSPPNGAALPTGSIVVQGYAIAGGNRYVARVDLSTDDGQSWTTVDLSDAAQPWTWRLWQTRLNPAHGECQIVVRAVDSAANTQPEDVRSIWNFKGYVNNAWHRVKIMIQ